MRELFSACFCDGAQRRFSAFRVLLFNRLPTERPLHWLPRLIVQVRPNREPPGDWSILRPDAICQMDLRQSP